MTKLKFFFNKVSKDTKIYTAEDIGEMSAEEFAREEKAIDYQMENLGIPFRNDLNGNSDVVYTQGYTRNDGSKVKAHYRSKSNGFKPFGGQPTGGAASGDWGEIFTDSQSYMKNNQQQNQSNYNYSSTPIKGGVTYNDSPLKRKPDNFKQHTKQSALGLANKIALDIGVNTVRFTGKQKDAAGMWNIASQPFYGNQKNYLNKNGKLYSGVNALGDEYNPHKETIRTKVKTQFGKDDVPGVVFHENSSIAGAINKSQELRDFVNKNAADLKAGKEVTGSIGFNSNSNLHNALGKTDVLSAKVKDGHVEVTILDTYDFNKDDPNWKVKMAHRAQKAGKLNPYYTIVNCRYKL